MRRFIFAVGIIILVIGFMLRAPSAQSLTFTSGRDCDDNAVIRCGALNFTELTNRYQNAGVAQIFSAFGISSQEMADIRTTAEAGKVTKDGRVFASGKLVATNAVTAGRQNMPGSTAVTSGGVTFYERPPSVSFAADELKAFVVMDGQRFKFAIIASCGNPVKATPIIRPAAKPQPPAPTPTPTQASPTPIQTQSQSQSVVVNSPPVVAAAEKSQKTPAPTQAPLPNTGPGGVLMLFGGVTSLAGLGHWIYYRRFL